MISIRCGNCDKHLKVRAELAGKKVRCPQCKQTLEVPVPSSEDATVAPDGVRPAREDATIAPGWSPPTDGESAHAFEETGARGTNEETEALSAAAHYEVAGEIARGGMGAIMRAVDKDIRREVAVKFLLNSADDRLKTRFMEEAQITGQLEHPNIVPIHQLGAHEDGRCFFSMKMIKGQSLAEILKQQAEPEAPAADGVYTLGRLLGIMIGICNALAYAHSRRVIHRDLKPANIMVGDFGEVYVMDWGLAKVLQESGVSGEESEISDHATAIKSLKAERKNRSAEIRAAKGSATVVTGRDADSSLTQAGAIMGTPAYMPPEQAQGDAGKIDQRSDIYSLGAILYEMMTLTPPVGRGGDMVSIIMRVVEGKIDPPAQRAPERARAGWIPLELSAIALKALAAKRKDRYQTVEAMKRDIDLFLEGRSVSAKQDSTWEMFKKLVKRNKGASAGVAAALLVLLVSLGFIVNAYSKLESEQEARRAQGKQSAPAFLEDARHSTARMKIEHALAQVNVALDFDPDLTDAWLLKGQLLIGQKKFEEAQKNLTVYLKQKPGDADAKKLLDLCALPNTDDIPVLLDFSETLTRQKAVVLAEVMLGYMGDRKDFFQRLFKLYQGRLDAAWPGASAGFGMDVNGDMNLNLGGSKLVKDVADLAPLQGMKLTYLDLRGAEQVADLTPLQGMNLQFFSIAYSKVSELSPLQGMKLRSLNLSHCTRVADLSPLTGMPLTSLDLTYCNVTDLGPLAGMPLDYLRLFGVPKLQDLTPLKETKLTSLDLVGSLGVRDLTPLRGLKLTSLSLSGDADLAPLRSMKLKSLLLDNPGSDLSPLNGMKLTSLALGVYQGSDLSPLTGMPLTSLNLSRCPNVSTLEPLQGMKLIHLQLEDCPKVTSLEPLQGMKLETLVLRPTVNRGLEIVRNMNSLKTIDGKPAAQFWKEHDAKMAGK